MLFVVFVIVGYMLLLVGLAVAAPGIGFTGSLIDLVPGGWRDWAHVPAYGVLAWLVMTGFRLRGWPLSYALFVGVLSTVVFGLWTEVAQGAAPGREASLDDVLHDLLGGMMAGALVLWQHRVSHRVQPILLSRRTNQRDLMKGMLSR